MVDKLQQMCIRDRHSRVRIVSKIAAERNGDTVLTPAEITHYCENNANELLYLLQSYEGTNYTYDKQLGVFIIGDDSLHDRVDAFLESLPNIVTTEQFKKYVDEAEEAEDIPKEMFEKAFLSLIHIFPVQGCSGNCRGTWAYLQHRCPCTC